MTDNKKGVGTSNPIGTTFMSHQDGFQKLGAARAGAYVAQEQAKKDKAGSGAKQKADSFSLGEPEA